MWYIKHFKKLSNNFPKLFYFTFSLGVFEIYFFHFLHIVTNTWFSLFGFSNSNRHVMIFRYCFVEIFLMTLMLNILLCAHLPPIFFVVVGLSVLRTGRQFSSTICWKDYLLSTEEPVHVCFKINCQYRCGSIFELCFVPLLHLSILTSVLHSLDYSSFIINQCPEVLVLQLWFSFSWLYSRFSSFP